MEIVVNLVFYQFIMCYYIILKIYIYINYKNKIILISLDLFNGKIKKIKLIFFNLTNFYILNLI